MDGERIRHTVVFALAHPAGSDAERDFLEAAERLAAIPGVHAFELLAEVSPKNEYRFGISMEFADRSELDPAGDAARREETRRLVRGHQLETVLSVRCRLVVVGGAQTDAHPLGAHGAFAAEAARTTVTAAAATPTLTRLTGRRIAPTSFWS
jgi:hypothetical protein